MKRLKIIFSITIISSFLLATASCFQDLNQDPSFDYPEGGGQQYAAQYDETFYMSYEADPYYVDSISLNNVLAVGTPSFADGKIGKAYLGAANSYLSVNVADLKTPLTTAFSATLWYKMGTATRAGILTCGKNNAAHDERKFGFRFFREGSATAQRFKLNMGNGSAEVYADGGVAADLDPAVGWVFLTFTIAEGRCAVYFNGTLVKETAFTGAVDWDGCESISIGSGAPTFTVWSHLSDTDLIDELRFFNKELTVAEITELMNATH
ncbi:MAG: LamG domain-containing protein [Prevotellaceae bacterium]|jgi:hypothetical protein|nr:LamG domain-containing protein [Prevotellaceae bacterium]